MSQPKSSPYGSWPSPITSDLIVAQSIALSEVRLDGDSIYWLEARPQEQGRLVVVRADWRGGGATDMTPRPYSARTRVHEYGGGAWTVSRGIVCFSNFSNGRLYRSGEAAPQPEALTPAPPAPDRQWRFADGVIDHARQRWIGVREDHTAEGEAGQHHRGDRSRPERAAARPCSRRRTRLLRRPAAFAGRPSAALAGVGPSQHAVERHRALSCRTRRRRSRLSSRGRSPAAQRSRSSNRNGRLTAARSTSSPIAAAGGTCTASIPARGSRKPLAPMAAEFGGPQWNLGDVDLCLPRQRPDRLRLCDVRGPRPACGAGACRQDVAADRDAVHGVRLGQGRRRTRRVSRRRTRPSDQHRRAGSQSRGRIASSSRPPRSSSRASRASPIG